MDDSNTEVTVTLTVAEVNTLLQVLGDQPTKMGLWPLVLKIKTGAETSLALVSALGEKKE